MKLCKAKNVCRNLRYLIFPILMYWILMCFLKFHVVIAILFGIWREWKLKMMIKLGKYQLRLGRNSKAENLQTILSWKRISEKIVKCKGSNIFLKGSKVGLEYLLRKEFKETDKENKIISDCFVAFDEIQMVITMPFYVGAVNML